MLLNFILILIIICIVALVYFHLRKHLICNQILPECNFIITNPEFTINDSIKIAKFNVIISEKNRYFQDFPLGFKFYSDQKFRSNIKISYNISDDDEIEVIYDKIVDFEDTIKEHDYYINDIIMGSIDIEIYTNISYGNPKISFEILQSNRCHMKEPHKLEIIFP